MHATIPKGNMGYDQYTVLDTVASRALLSNLFELHSELKTTRNTCRDCRVHFFDSFNLSRNSCIQGVPKVRSSTLQVRISVRLNLLSKSLKQKLCLSI